MVAFAALMVSRLAVAARWYLLLAATALEIPWLDALRFTFAGLFASNFLPTTIGGDVVRFGGAARQKYDVAIVAASVLVDRVIGMAGMLLVFLAGALLYLKDWIAIEAPFAVLGASFFYQHEKLAKLWRRGRAALSRVLQAFGYWGKRPASILLSFLMTCIHMTFLFLSLYLLVLGMGDSLSFGLVATLWSLVYFVTLLPISINGYGVQEVSLTFALTKIGALPLEHSVAIALLFRTLFIVASLPGAAFLPKMIAGKNKTYESITD